MGQAEKKLLENIDVEFLTLSKEQLLTMLRNKREKKALKTLGGGWWEGMGKINSEERKKGGKGREINDASLVW